jgi:AraC family transcriptional regulator of arabinose operon
MKRYYAYITDEEVFSTEKDLHIVNCGYDSITSETIHYTRLRPDFYLLLVTAGKCTHIHKGKRYCLKEGNMFLYYPNEKQEYICRAKDKPSWYWVHFTGKKAIELVKELNLSSGAIYPENTTAIFKLFNKLFNEYKLRECFYEKAAENFLRELLISTIREETFFSLKKDFAYVIERIISTPNISNEECAKICNFSTVHFIRLFKKAYGITPHKYKQKVIIDQAKELLHSTTKTVGTISELLGFENNPLYFNKLFKSITGMTPTEYRQYSKRKSLK